MANAECQQKQALCWPWTDPFQRFWIISGKAQGHTAHDNWGNYPFARNHRLMTWLGRLRRLATIIWFFMCLLYLSGLTGWLPAPWFQTIGRLLLLKPE